MLSSFLVGLALLLAFVLLTTSIHASSSEVGSLFNPQTQRSYHKQGLFSWNPHPEKYILLVCMFGQVSNRLICIRHHLLLAGLSNRTIVIPFTKMEVKRNYDRRIFLDIKYLESCYGKRRIITTSEYFHIHKTKVKVDQIFCVGHTGCDWNVLKELRRTVAFHPARKTDSAEWLKNQKKLPEVVDTLSKLDKRVVVLGDLYYYFALDFLPEIMEGGDLPFVRSHACDSGLVIRPHQAMFQAAQLYINQTFKDQKFVSIHWRRGDFSKYCKAVNVGCFYPIEQISECILNKMQNISTGNIFIASNGSPFEISRLEQLLQAKGDRNLSIFMLPKLLSPQQDGDTWMNPLLGAKFTQPALVLLELDKLICSYSHLFLGSIRSSFTLDIERLRYGLNTSHPEDSFICNVYSKQQAR